MLYITGPYCALFARAPRLAGRMEAPPIEADGVRFRKGLGFLMAR